MWVIFHPMRFLFRWFYRLLKLAIFLIILGTIIAILPLRWINPPITNYVVQANLSGNQYQNLRETWVNYHDIPDTLKLAVITAEDQRFPSHRGIDWSEVKNALADYQRGKPLRGASTLTQQLAKNIYLWPDRSLPRKGIEAWLAMSMELMLSKERILELYLNTAQFSRPYFGVERSSQYLFNKSVTDISESEAAHLASCLPSPSMCKPGVLNNTLKKRQAFIRKYMDILGVKYLQLL